MITIKQELKAMVDLICLFSFLEIDWIMIPPALETTIYIYTLIVLDANYISKVILVYYPIVGLLTTGAQ